MRRTQASTMLDQASLHVHLFRLPPRDATELDRKFELRNRDITRRPFQRKPCGDRASAPPYWFSRVSLTGLQRECSQTILRGFRSGSGIWENVEGSEVGRALSGCIF